MDQLAQVSTRETYDFKLQRVTSTNCLSNGFLTAPLTNSLTRSLTAFTTPTHKSKKRHLLCSWFPTSQRLTLPREDPVVTLHHAHPVARST